MRPHCTSSFAILCVSFTTLVTSYRPVRHHASPHQSPLYASPFYVSPITLPLDRQIPLVAYSGASDVKLSVTAETGLRLGELHPGATVHAPLTVTNVGDRRAYVNVLGYRGERRGT